ncbi:MAG: anthranilate synthase component [Alphaproteobacteria bacterium]|nr:anthranilate synthase component [Alphaproteobacteria bacterium]
MNILLIDNLDSFSFNLVEAVERLGAKVRVVRNTIGAAAALAEAERNDAMILLSPGPGRPENAGCCIELIAAAKARVPLLGVCLGHQAIVLEAGGEVGSAPEPVHGKASLLPHDGRGPFEGSRARSGSGAITACALGGFPSASPFMPRLTGWQWRSATAKRCRPASSFTRNRS